MNNIRIRTISLIIFVIVLILASNLFLFVRQQRGNLEKRVEDAKASAVAQVGMMSSQIEKQYLSRISSFAANRKNIINALAERDREKLYALCLPLYTLLRKENIHFSRMGFILPDHTVFLRVHAPQSHGDKMTELLPAMTEKINLSQPFSGFEVGHSGLFFRVSHPLFAGGDYVGTVTFGIDVEQFIEPIRQGLKMESGVVLLPSQAEKIVTPIRELIPMGEYVLLSGAVPFLPGERLTFAERGQEPPDYRTDSLTVFPVYPIQDNLGKTLGHILVALDLADLVVPYKKIIAEAMLISLFLLATAVLVLYLSFGRIFKEIISLNRALADKNRELTLVGEERETVIDQRNQDLVEANMQLEEEIGQRKTADHSLQEALAQWQRSFDAIVDPLLILDRDLRVVKANQVARDLLAPDGEEINGQTCYELFVGSETPCTSCPSQQGDNLHAGGTMEFQHRSLGLVFLMHCAPIIVEDVMTGYVLEARDITHQRNLEKQLVQAQKMEAISTLAGGIAHDFNNILGAILGNADLLLYRLPGPGEEQPEQKKSQLDFSEVGEHVKAIKQAGLRAKGLVGQILSFSRQSINKRKKTDITPLIKEGVKLLRASLPTTIDLTYHQGKNIGLINADPTQIHQVLMNLCTNAAQSLDNEIGTIAVTLEECEIASAESKYSGTLNPGKYITLSVADTGKGMSKEVQERIFDPFFTTREVGEGTGMGLSVLHGIVTAHEGCIDVQSEKGKGTVFTIYFPRMEETITENTDTVTAMPMGSETVLFVDDEEDIVRMRSRMLEYLGYQVVTASGAEQALQYITTEGNTVDIVITDQTMPRMTGLQLATEISARFKHIPIILCSGYSEAVTEEQARVAGISRFLTKPLEMRLLAMTLRELLSDEE